MDSNDKRLDFLHKIAKLGLQHFDTGGNVQASNLLTGPGASGTSTGGNGPQGLLQNVSAALGNFNNFQGQAAQTQAGTNAGQLNTAYTGTQNALAAQQALQSQAATGGTQGFASQNALAAQLQAQANGQGPNVAQNQLNQATGANVANQAALMAGQRGSSANVGLLARQNAQQGAGIQQQAAGQAATLGAQQQIAAQQNLANLAATQVGQAGQATSGLTQAQQGEQSILQNANSSYNNAITGMQSNINNVNAQTAAGNQGGGSGLGGIVGGIGGAVSSITSLFAKGGEVQKYASGGNVIVGNPLVSGNSNPGGPQSWAGQWLNSNAPASGTNIQSTPSFGNAPGTAMNFGQGVSSAIDSIKGAFTKPPMEGAEEIGDEGSSDLPSSMGMAAEGGKVNAKSPKQKAVKANNSYDNDKVPAMLSEGEIVLPRSITTHPQAPEMAADFVRKTLAKKGLRK